MFDKLIDLIISSIKLFRLFVVIREFERGVILRFGKFRKVAEPGIAWICPLGVDCVYDSPAYVLTMIVGPQSLNTKDNKEVVVSVLVTYLVFDHKLHLISIQGQEQSIEDISYGVVAKFVMDRTWDELLHEDVSKELTKQMRQRADDYGVKVKNAQIVDFTKSRSIRLISHANKAFGAQLA